MVAVLLVVYATLLPLFALVTYYTFYPIREDLAKYRLHWLHLAAVFTMAWPVAFVSAALVHYFCTKESPVVSHVHVIPVDPSLTPEEAWKELCIFGKRVTNTGRPSWANVECPGEATDDDAPCRNIEDPKNVRGLP